MKYTVIFLIMSNDAENYFLYITGINFKITVFYFNLF